MSQDPVFTVCSAGRAGAAIAADISLMGYKVTLFELDHFKDSIEPIMKRGGIEVTGRTQSGKIGFAQLHRVTTDPAEAVRGADIVMIAAPAFAHESFVEAIAEFLEEGQCIMFNTGYWACMRIADALKKRRIFDRVTLAEANIMPYLSDKKDHCVHIFNVKQDIKLATFPGKRPVKALDAIRLVYPQHIRVPNVIWTNFAAGNPSLHSTLMLPIAGIPLDRFMGCRLYGEATAPSARLIEGFDRERLQIAKALGCEVGTAFDWVQKTYGYHGKDIAEAFRKSPHADRYIPRERLIGVTSEDIEFFYVPMTRIGDLLGIHTPITKAIVEIMGTMLEIDYWAKGLTLEKLGLAGFARDQIVRYADTGQK
jgi:opine dehydrogenase